MASHRLKVTLSAHSDEFLAYNGDTHKLITLGAQGRTVGLCRSQIISMLGQVQAMDAVNTPTLDARMLMLQQDIERITEANPTIHRDEESIFGWDIALYRR